MLHLASGASIFEIPKSEEVCNIDTKPHLVVPSAVSDDDGYDDDSLKVDDIAMLHLASGASIFEIPKSEEVCNIDTKPHLVVPSAVSDDDGYDDDSLKVDDIAMLHLASGASIFEIPKSEEVCNIDTKPHLVVPSAVSDDDGYDDDSLKVDDIAMLHLASGASIFEIPKSEEVCNIDTKPHLVVPSAVSDDDGYDDDSLKVDDIAMLHLASGASIFEIPKSEEVCNIDTKPHLVVPSAVSDDDGYDNDSLSSISVWSSLFDESDDDDDISSFTTVSELSNFTWDLFEETNSSTMNFSIFEVDDDGVDNYTIAQMLLEQLLNEIV
eukprot:XP_011672265.1 PREDICTED: uncharacterized protein LOC105442125 [Strongylocentrotus purpuratus]